MMSHLIDIRFNGINALRTFDKLRRFGVRFTRNLDLAQYRGPELLELERLLKQLFQAGGGEFEVGIVFFLALLKNRKSLTS